MNIALLGFGVVGSGVYEWCRDRADLHVTRVLVRSPKPAVADISTTDFNDIVTDEDIRDPFRAPRGAEINMIKHKRLL